VTGVQLGGNLLVVQTFGRQQGKPRPADEFLRRVRGWHQATEFNAWYRRPVQGEFGASHARILAPGLLLGKVFCETLH
jgi:hypothetical protein